MTMLDIGLLLGHPILPRKYTTLVRKARRQNTSLA